MKKIAVFDDTDACRWIVQKHESDIAADISILPEGWTWRLLEVRHVPGEANFVSDPPVYSPAACPPLTEFPKPEDAPR